jgi:ABC-type amino acid transport substrate-binding protein
MLKRSIFFAFFCWAILLVYPGLSISETTDPLVVTVSETYPPFTQIDINGEPAGMFVDIWNLWAKKSGRQIAFKATDWAGTLAALKSGEADIHSGLFYSEKRNQWVDYSQAFYVNRSSFYQRIGEPSHSSDATLKGVKIGVVKGYLQETFLNEAYTNADIVSFADDRELIKALASAKIDLFLSEDPTIEALLAETGMLGKIGSVGSAVQTNDHFAGVLNGRTDLLNVINDGFQKITSSEWEQIEARWIKDPAKRIFGTNKRKSVDLTAKEKAWIDTHPVIRTIALKNWPPVDFQTSDGKHAGIAADILKLAAERVGLKVTPQFGPWSEMLEKLKQGDIDLAPEIYHTEGRAKVLAYSRPFLPLYNAIFVGPGVRNIKAVSDLTGRNVAVEKGYALEGVLKADYPGINPVLVDSTLDALKLVSVGEVDAYVGSQYVASYLIEQNLLHSVKPAAHFGDKPQFLHMAVPNDRIILRDIMDKALGAISETEKRTIIQHYAPASFLAAVSTADGSINLSDEEKGWLKKKHVIRVANETDWPPFDFVENDKPTGFSIDMIKKVAGLVGLKVEFVNGFIWPELVNKFHDGSIDVLPAVYFTPKRSKTMDFTNGYAVNPPALAFKKDRTELNSLEDLKGLKLAVLSDTSFDHLLKERYPDIIRVPIDGAVQGMEAVAFGQADGFIESLSVASALMEKNLISNIRLIRADGLQKKGENDLRMAVKKEDTILRDILQKGLNGIDSKTKSQLFENYFNANRTLYEIRDQVAKEVILTKAEQSWLKDHPVLRVAPDPDYPPLEFFDDKGEYQGLAASFMRLVADRVDFKLEVVRKENWTGALNALRSGEADFIAANTPTTEFLKEFIYSDEYYKFFDAIITHENIKGRVKLQDLGGKEILVVKDWPEVHILKERYPDIKVVEVESTLEAMTKVAFKEYDYAFVYFPTASHFIREQALPGLRVAGIEGDPIGDAAMFRKDSEIMRNIITKGLATISEQEKRELKDRWIPSVGKAENGKEPKIKFTSKEKKWLKEHPVLRYSEINWKPLSIIEDGRMQGVLGDYLDIITEGTGIKFQFISADSWPDVLKKFKEKEIDIVPAVGNTERYKALGSISTTYSSHPLVIVGKSSASFVNGPEDLEGQALAIPKFYTSYNYIKNNFPNLKIRGTTSIEEALSLVATGEADAFIGHKLVAIYNMANEYADKLKIIGITEFKFEHRVLIQNTDPELLSIVNKVIDSISVKQKRKIYDDWVKIKIEQAVDFVLLLKIGAGILAFILFILFWNRKMGRELNNYRLMPVGSDMA